MNIKPKITISPIDNRKLCSFNINHPVLGDISVASRMDYNDGFKRLFIELLNKQKKILANEELALGSNTDSITGLYIQVNPEYTNNGKRNFRLGEIVRLASIIEMLENKKTLFKIYSKSTAIYFHSKYKFEPNITSFHERDAALLTIIQDKNKNFSDLSQKGKNLQHKINICQTAEEQRELCLSVNKLIKEYIERAKNPAGNYKFHPFQSGIDMILTNKNLIKHKDFFNNLFKKHGIDYNI